MDWIQFSQGHRLDPIAGGTPEAIVILLHDYDPPSAMLFAAARWAATAPTTGFVVFDSLDKLDPPCGRQCHAVIDPVVVVDAIKLDAIAKRLEPLIADEQRHWQLDVSRFVLVGFHRGGTVALRFLLHGRSCAGVLGFSPSLPQPLPQAVRIDRKIRLVECIETRDANHADLRADVASLMARGIDARGVLLAGSALSDEALRYGGAYLVELIATAQHSDGFHVLDDESRRS